MVDFRGVTRGHRGAEPGAPVTPDAGSAWSASATGARTWPATSTACPSAELRWICDASEERARALRRRPSPTRAPRADLDELLADPELDAVVLATHVPTHADLAVRVLEAGKHCFVEKPLAQSVGRRRAGGRGRGRGRPRADGRPPARVPPGRGEAQARSPTAASSATSATSTRNRLNLGKLRADENALWSLGAHDVSVLLRLAGEEPVRVPGGRARATCAQGVEDVVFCYLRFPSGLAAHLHLSWLDPHKERRFTVVGSKKMATFDDMELERKVTVYDKGFDQDFESYGEYIARSGDIRSPRVLERGAAADRVPRTSSSACATAPSRARAASSGLRVVRVLEALQRSLEELACCARLTARPGLLLGEGVELPASVELGGNVVIHAGHASSARGCGSRTAPCSASRWRSGPARRRPREAPPPLEMGEGATICAGAVVVAGRARSAPGAVVGDQAHVRERARDRRGHGGRARVAGGQRRDDRRRACGSRPAATSRPSRRSRTTCSWRPGVTLTNDDTMGRHGPDHALRGATLRRACRVGGGAVLLPGVEVGEEAFVAAGRRGDRATCRRARW